MITQLSVLILDLYSSTVSASWTTRCIRCFGDQSDVVCALQYLSVSVHGMQSPYFAVLAPHSPQTSLA